MTFVTTGSRLMTSDELIRLPDDAWRYELVRGELRRMPPPGYEHGKIAMRVASRLAPFVEQHGLGETYAAETGFLIHRHPDTVRAPDCAFVTAAKLAAMAPLPQGYLAAPPDLAVEVLSPSDSYSEVEEKVADWLDAGCQAVIVIDPRRKMASLHRAGSRPSSFAEADRLEIPDLLPGWSLALAEIFR